MHQIFSRLLQIFSRLSATRAGLGAEPETDLVTKKNVTTLQLTVWDCVSVDMKIQQVADVLWSSVMTTTFTLNTEVICKLTSCCGDDDYKKILK